MARLLLRIRSQPFLTSPSPLRTSQLLLHRTVLQQTTRTWCAGSAALEDSSGVDTTSGPSDSERETVKQDVTAQKGKHRFSSNAVNISDEKSSSESSENLSSLILNKMRGKGTTVGRVSVTSQKEGTKVDSHTPSNMNATTVTSTEDKSIQDNKWAQVMSSIRKIAAKNKAAAALDKPDSGQMNDSENVDDFADLDHPQSGHDRSSSRNSNRNSLANAFKKDYTPNNKLQKGFQGGNLPRSKEMKSGHFNFLNKPRDSNGSVTRTDMSTERNYVDRSGPLTRDSLSNPRMKANWNQQMNKEARPVSFEPLKAPETKSDNHQEDARPANTNEGNQGKDIFVPYSGYTVSIQNVPSHCNIGLVKHALSSHGEILRSFKKSESNGSRAIYIEFKTAEAMDNALTLREIQLEGKLFPITRPEPPITTVVRLSRVGGITQETQIRSICEKYGSLDNIKKRGNGIYDVFYKVKELPNIPNILESLNEVTLNQRRWIASVAPALHPGAKKEVLSTSDGKAWHAAQSSQMLSKIEIGLDAMSICFEDLKALIHMEDEALKR